MILKRTGTFKVITDMSNSVDEESETTTCDLCGTNMNGKAEVCEDCLYWSCSLIDEKNEDEISERHGIPTEAMYDKEVSKI